MALRPVVQDGVLPTVAMACGPGELAYLAQLREVFEGLDVRAACPVPRFSATWLPPAAIALSRASGADPWDVVAATDAVVLPIEGQETVAPPLSAAQEAQLRRYVEERMLRHADAAAGNEGLLPVARLPRRVEER